MTRPDIELMSGVEFEVFVAGVLRHNGYAVAFTPPTGDFGVDLIARRGTAIVAVQCKRHRGLVGVAAVQQVVAGAAMYDCTSAMVVSNRSFTTGAVALAARNNCALIDGAELERLGWGRNPDVDAHVPAKYGGPPRTLGGHRRSIQDFLREVRISRNAREGIEFAQETARELNSAEIQPEHLLAGVLQSARRDLSGVFSGCGLTAGTFHDRLASADRRDEESFEADAEALRAIGIDLRAVRAAVDRNFGPGTYDNALRTTGRRGRRRGHIPLSKPAKKVLELSLREALAHKDNWIGCEHIMLGILRGGDRFTIGLINEHVDTAQLRAAVVGLLDEAA
jgi:hypothetical protein